MSGMDLSLFRAKYPLRIRFSDLDYLGHVNNANYLTFLEEARIHYFSDIITSQDVDWQSNGLVVARIEIDFKQPIIGFRDYFIYLRCSRMGNKSFDFQYVITFERQGKREVMAEATSVMVCFDYGSNRTIAMKSEWKDKFREFEQNL